MTDQLANDRTFLAWLRTAIALFGLGFVVSKISLIADPGGERFSDAAAYSTVGVLLVLAGAAVIVVGYRQHRDVTRNIRTVTGEETPTSQWAWSFTLSAVTGAAVLSALIVLTT